MPCSLTLSVANATVDERWKDGIRVFFKWYWQGKTESVGEDQWQCRCARYQPHTDGTGDLTGTSVGTGGRLRMVQKTLMGPVELRSCDLVRRNVRRIGLGSETGRSFYVSWNFRLLARIVSWSVVTDVVLSTLLLFYLLCFGFILFILHFVLSPSSNCILSVLTSPLFLRFFFFVGFPFHPRCFNTQNAT